LANNIRILVMLAVGLMVVAVIYPIALGLIGNSGNVVINSTVNATNNRLSDVIDPAVLTLLTVLLPIIAIIAVVLIFLPGNRD